MVDRRARMAGLADIARLNGVGKFAGLVKGATRKYCLVWFELPCWSEWPGSGRMGVSGHTVWIFEIASTWNFIKDQ